ncbi:MAG: SDR family NAD(P)-dependent oxidoreductase, partial [Proteobacteria bacterium]|nr:SDR family NAD(P)-dependent oxidoreductase [Pseudomonadota bacterium]
RQRLSLPTYPFERQRHWIDAKAPPGVDAAASHPHLGTVHAAASGERTYTQILRASRPAWLRDHKVFGGIVLPGAAYGSMVAAAVGIPCRITGMQFHAALALDDASAARELQLILRTAAQPGVLDCAFYSRDPTPAGGKPAAWQLHAEGRVEPAGEVCVPPRPADAVHDLDVDAFHQRLTQLGIDWGPNWRGVTRLRGAEGVAWGAFSTPACLDAGMWPIAPPVLDACFGMVAAAILGYTPETDVLLPYGWEALEIWATAPRDLTCDIRLRTSPGQDPAVADLWLRDPAGAVFGRVTGLMLKRATQLAMATAARRHAASESPDAGVDAWLYDVSWLPVMLESTETTALWLLLGDVTRRTALAAALTRHGASVIADAGDDPAGLSAAIRHAAPGYEAPRIGVVWLAEAPTACSEFGATAIQRRLAPVLKLIHTLNAEKVGSIHSITLVTSGAVAVAESDDVDPTGAAVWGFGRVVQAEQPEQTVRLVDVPGGAEHSLAEGLLAKAAEPQLAWRDGTWHTPRLLPARAGGRLARPTGDVRLDIGVKPTPEALRLIPLALDPPRAGEVMVAVHAAGLNFRDVLNTLGLYPGDAGALGAECAGEVIAVGPGVDTLAPGDAVFGFAEAGFASRCISPASLLRRVPDGIDFAAAASLPVAFCTAQACFELAGLRAGQRVLIHAGAGGVGLAAIQLARAIGTEVLATASAAKRPFLHRYGVAHVFDSRSTSFAAEVLAATDGQGVDVVINSLTGPGFVEASLSVLAKGGQFVEISKRDTWSFEQMSAKRPDVRYHLFALDEWLWDAPDRVARLLDLTLDGLAAGRITPPPRRCFTLNEAPAAMRLMQRAGHIGKIVLTVDHAEPRRDGAYLVTGGLGALGLAAASWLAEQGAGHVVLASRRDPDAAVLAGLASLSETAGCTVEARRLDVADATQVQVLVDWIGRERAPLRGVIHAAGVLDDGVIAAQSWERFAAVLAPKLLGGWHLHQAT